ncbi:MAG: hypothetical protein Q8R25_00490 [bacterium]|nr:hypothetical protein [bacterium]
MEWLLWFGSSNFYELAAALFAYAVLPIILLSELYRRFISKKPLVTLDVASTQKIQTVWVFAGAFVAFALLAAAGFFVYKTSALNL